MEKRENFSRKRTAILNALEQTTVHPTADWVYENLKPKYPDLSLGTVYRNLKKFCETGKAMSIGVINGQERFDGNTESHSHFVCSNCGVVLDVAEAFFKDEEFSLLNKKYDFAVSSAEVLFKGLCDKCKEEK